MRVTLIYVRHHSDYYYDCYYYDCRSLPSSFALIAFNVHTQLFVHLFARKIEVEWIESSLLESGLKVRPESSLGFQTHTSIYPLSTHSTFEFTFPFNFSPSPLLGLTFISCLSHTHIRKLQSSFPLIFSLAHSLPQLLNFHATLLFSTSDCRRFNFTSHSILFLSFSLSLVFARFHVQTKGTTINYLSKKCTHTFLALKPCPERNREERENVRREKQQRTQHENIITQLVTLLHESHCLYPEK